MYLVEYEFELHDGRHVLARLPADSSILTAGDAMRGILTLFGDLLELGVIANCDCWISYDKSLDGVDC